MMMININNDDLDSCDGRPYAEKVNALRDRIEIDSTTALAMRWAEERGTST